MSVMVARGQFTVMSMTYCTCPCGAGANSQDVPASLAAWAAVTDISYTLLHCTDKRGLRGWLRNCCGRNTRVRIDLDWLIIGPVSNCTAALIIGPKLLKKEVATSEQVKLLQRVCDVHLAVPRSLPHFVNKAIPLAWHRSRDSSLSITCVQFLARAIELKPRLLRFGMTTDVQCAYAMQRLLLVIEAPASVDIHHGSLPKSAARL